MTCICILCIYACMHVFVHVCTYVCVYVGLCTSATMHVCTYVCLYMPVYVCIYVWHYAHMHVCINAFICMHIAKGHNYKLLQSLSELVASASHFLQLLIFCRFLRNHKMLSVQAPIIGEIKELKFKKSPFNLHETQTHDGNN